MRYIIEYHNGMEWNPIGNRPTLAEAEAEVALRSKVWRVAREAFSIKVKAL